MSNAELDELVRRGDRHRGKALFVLVDRAGADPEAASRLAELSRLPVTREDRLFHAISLAWAAIIGLLAAEQPSTRALAYEAFSDLDRAEQEGLLSYLGERRIEDAHPPPL